MSKIKILIEKYYPLFNSSLIICIVSYSKYISDILEKNKDIYDISLLLSTIIIAILITHKSIILTMENNKGFQKLLTGKKITNRFFKYLNHTINTCIIIIIYSFIILISERLAFIKIMLFLLSLLIFQFVRFIRSFDEVFEKSLIKKTN